MRTLRFVIVFIGIVIKGCMESPAIKTTLILLASVATLVFVPYWIGLLITSILPGIFPPPAWAGGLVCIIVVILVTAIIVGAYRLVYEWVKYRMWRKR